MNGDPVPSSLTEPNPRSFLALSLHWVAAGGRANYQQSHKNRVESGEAPPTDVTFARPAKHHVNVKFIFMSSRR